MHWIWARKWVVWYPCHWKHRVKSVRNSMPPYFVLKNKKKWLRRKRSLPQLLLLRQRRPRILTAISKPIDPKRHCTHPTIIPKANDPRNRPLPLRSTSTIHHHHQNVSNTETPAFDQTLRHDLLFSAASFKRTNLRTPVNPKRSYRHESNLARLSLQTS